jgi:hypothetical protein
LPEDPLGPASRIEGVVSRSLPRLGTLVGVACLVGCSVVNGDSETTGEGSGKMLSAQGISIDVPPGWYGRISARGRPLPGAALLHVASFPLPRGDDDNASKARKAMGRSDVLLVLSEGLREANLPLESPRIEPGERLFSFGPHFFFDRSFVAAGRLFIFQATFRSRLPPKRLIRTVNAALASLAFEPRSKPLRPARDPAPARVFEPVRLLPTPPRIVNQCQLAQARSSHPILCPARLPRPFVGWPQGGPPKAVAQRLPAPGVSWRSRSDPRYRNRSFSGVSIAYAAPWEPDSGPDWQLHLWRNRPCCFLHFEVFWRREGRRHVPVGARPATLGGRRGLLKDATSYGVASRENDYLYWANHTRFLWRETGVDYVATLHRFGTKEETRALLSRLIRELRPATNLR